MSDVDRMYRHKMIVEFNGEDEQDIEVTILTDHPSKVSYEIEMVFREMVRRYGKTLKTVYSVGVDEMDTTRKNNRET